ncbi:MAG TPA: AtpZ/AtpI family protein [Cyclobacteriaceae bacterium]
MTQKKRKKESSLKRNLNSTNTAAKVSGLAFELFVIIFLAVWGGYELDEYLGYSFPVFLLVFLILALISSVVMIIRNLPK